MSISNKKIFTVFIALSVIYILEALIIPADSTLLSKFKMSETEARLWGLTVILPVIAIWMIGGYVYTKFNSYTKSISADRDGKALSLISTGLLFLVLWLPISTTFSQAATHWYRTNPSATVPLVIINNYLNLILVLIAFAIIYKGAIKLTELKNVKESNKWKTGFFALLTVISWIFIYLTLTNPARQLPTSDVKMAAFYLPDWLIVSTIIIPYILVFYFGFFSVYYLYIYRRNVRGIIYKSALDNFAKGLFCIVSSIIFIRYLATLTTLFNSSTLKIILLIIYFLLALLLLGFILLSKSVNKLHKIEKV